MSHTPPKRPRPKADADFSWPPPDKELEQRFLTLRDTASADEDQGVDEVPEVRLYDPATAAREAAKFNARQIQASRVRSSESQDAALDRSPDDEGLRQPAAEALKHSATERVTTSSIAAAQSEHVLDDTSVGIAAEIARLQALIEELTQR